MIIIGVTLMLVWTTEIIPVIFRILLIARITSLCDRLCLHNGYKPT